MPENIDKTKNIEKYLYNKRKQIKEKKKEANRFQKLFVLNMVLFVLCTMVVGKLYIIKNSPDHSYIIFRDRSSPMAVVTDARSFNGVTYEIEDFVDSVEDLTDVSISYVTEPDYDTDGNQEIVIRFTDEAGNYVDKSLNLEVVHDTTAPVIYGDDDYYTYWNEAISYKSLVTVEDDYDSEDEIELEIDNSQVDITTLGDYDVVYTATDSAGNTSTKTITIHVQNPDTDEYYLAKANELCDKIISQIITDDMDKLHQVWAVYEYVRSIPYVLTDYTRNYIREGYKMLSEYRGDCYGSASAVKLLLDRLGIDNVFVTSDEKWNTHFWNEVSIDGGLTWYFVDATNWVEWGYLPNMCMISASRLEVISQRHSGTHIYVASDYYGTGEPSLSIPDDIVEKYNLVVDEPY